MVEAVEKVLGKRTNAEAQKDRKEAEKIESIAKEQKMYELRKGLRFVKQYSHEFKTFAKRRWIDKKLLDVFKLEFKAFSPQYYTEAIIVGKITVNGKIVDIDYRIREGDKIIHTTMRHETPILDILPKVVHEDEEFVAFDKPSSLPVHPCGNFMYNTLSKIAEVEMGYEGLKTVHRLDRQTSGIVFFAKH